MICEQANKKVRPFQVITGHLAKLDFFSSSRLVFSCFLCELLIVASELSPA